MPHVPSYIQPSGGMGNEPALASGCTGTPEVVISGGIASSVASLTFSTNFAIGDSVTFGGVTLTAVAANPNALQFVPSGTLAASLAALVIQLQALSQPVPGVYSQNGTVLTFTPGYGVTSKYSFTVPDVTANSVVAAGGNTKSSSAAAVVQTFANNFAAGDTITFMGVTLTAVVSAPNTYQFVPEPLLQQTLASLVNQFRELLNASVGTVSSTPTTITYTDLPNVAAVPYAVSTVKTSGGTATAIQSTNLGQPLIHLSLDTEHSQLVSATANQFVMLDDGVESQKKSVANLGAGSFNLKFAHPPTGVTNQIAIPAGAVAVLQFLSAKWRLILNDGGTLS